MSKERNTHTCITLSKSINAIGTIKSTVVPHAYEFFSQRYEKRRNRNSGFECYSWDDDYYRMVYDWLTKTYKQGFIATHCYIKFGITSTKKDPKKQYVYNYSLLNRIERSMPKAHCSHVCYV